MRMLWIIARQMSVLTVLLVMVVGDARSEGVELDGIIEPWEVVDIGAPAEGVVAGVAVERSSVVTRGQILVDLESSVEHAALEKAKTMADFRGEADIRKAQLAFAKRVHKRVKRLNAVSTHDKDQAATEVVLTRYRLKRARENKALAELELKKAQAVLARRTIRSPIDGVVVERYVSPGEYVNNQPLLRVAQTDPLRVEVIVPAPMFGIILPGMTATVVPELPAYSPQTATVTLVDQVIDSASSTFGVRLQLPNTEMQMPSGLRCLVRFDSVDQPLDPKKPARVAAGRTNRDTVN